MSDVVQSLPKIVEAYRRSAFNPIAGLTPESLARQLVDFKAGTLRDLALTMDAIEERDDVLATVVPKAKSSVARHGFEVVVNEEIPEGMEQLAQDQKEALQYFYDHVRVTSALEGDELGEFSLLVRQMMDAKGKRYAAHHIVWKSEGPGRYSAQFINVPLWFFEARTGRLRFIPEPYGYDGQLLEPGAWLVTVGQGIMRACVVAWMFKRMSLNDWVSFCEKFGFPGILGKTDAAKGSAEWDEMVSAVTTFANDWADVVNRSAEINLIEAKGNGALPFPPLVERMDRALAALWRGGDLSTMSKDGQAVGSNAQSGESDIIEQDDATWISETLRMKVDRLVLDYTFGPEVPSLAYVKVLTSTKQNVDLDLQIDAFAVANGHPISKKQFAERYSRPLPAPEDELLKAPIAAPSPFGLPALNERRRAINTSDTKFRQAALAKLSQAQSDALKPLRDRLQQIIEIEDESKQRAALDRFKAALPEFVKTLPNDQAVLDAFEEILGSAVVSGAAEAVRFRNPTS
jgi:phage gp29-like protein